MVCNLIFTLDLSGILLFFLFFIILYFNITYFCSLLCIYKKSIWWVVGLTLTENKFLLDIIHQATVLSGLDFIFIFLR